MSSLEVVGFDFDQTLADSTSGIHDCLIYTSQIYGAEVQIESLRGIAESGLKLDPMLRQFLPEDVIAQARQTFLDVYPQKGIAGTRAKEGADVLLQKLRDARIRLVLISAKSQHNLELSINHLKFDFDEVYGGVSGQEKTECILKSNTQIYIGDQESDVTAANKAGVRAVLVNQIAPIFDLLENPCWYFSNLSELMDALGPSIDF
jgi:phosphoglycolate phosphatase-like HAD superfamily hydrolase